MSPLPVLFSLLTFVEPDVSWLKEVTTPAASVMSASELTPLLKHQDGGIVTAESWPKRRQEILQSWNEFLGPMPARPKSGYEVLAREDLPKCVRQKIRYECEDKLFVEAYLLIPKTGQPAPGIVALHQTTKDTIDQIAGVSNGPAEQQLGIRLAERGFVVICPRCFLWENTPSLNAAVTTFKERHPHALGMRKMLYDAMRATDILLTVRECSGRIGAIGHSLGAKEVLYLAAFDDRIAATVASEGGVTFPSTNWDAPWYLGSAIRQPGFARNHHELLALIAPRPFLVLGGEKGPGAADGQRSWQVLQPAQDVSRLLKEPLRLGMINHGKGHSIPVDAFERSIEWLQTYVR